MQQKMEFARVPSTCSSLAFGLLLLVSLGCCEEAVESTLQPGAGMCEPIHLSFCQGLPYNHTVMPNVLGHVDQEAAGTEVDVFSPLVLLGCSPELQPFLCSVYAPECVNGSAKPVCRATCESARLGCGRLMGKLELSWPKELDCASFSYEACEYGLTASDIQRKLVELGHTVGDQVLSLQTARILMSLKDEEKSGKLNTNDFQELQSYVSGVKTEFLDYGKAGGGVVSEHQMKAVLRARDLRLNELNFRLLWDRYSAAAHVSYDDFVAIVARLESLKERFRAHRMTNLPCGCMMASFSLDDFIRDTLL
ncbi:secreted frizzled-related protein 2-like [Electrophorus electricus]|uniref:FZ domain-containing protein n=1 Tax=Electrophorus electricus TaxID=8005 RepID=A0AAY5F5B4_ELEEL|nr:secreted frizzled-related protein 2-like [Electrophorus electricus]